MSVWPSLMTIISKNFYSTILSYLTNINEKVEKKIITNEGDECKWMCFKDMSVDGITKSEWSRLEEECECVG